MDSLSEAVSFGSLLERYASDIDRWIGNRTRGMMNEKLFNEEVLQQTRIRIWERLGSYKAQASGALPERAWVYCQTREAFVDVWRRECRAGRGKVAAGHFESWIIGIGESKIIESVTGLLSKLVKKDAAMRAKALLEELKPSDRESVTLRDLDGLSFREIGAALGICEQLARQQHFRAIKRLRDLWKGESKDSEMPH